MEIQHINVKLILGKPEDNDLEPLIHVFHSWIQDQVCDELLLDVGDYRHVHAGPGVILVGHEANYSVDNTNTRLGVRYNRKAPLEGSNQDRLKQATEAALRACDLFESDPRLNGKFRFDGRGIEVSVNDRLLAPNNPATREAIRPELRQFLQGLFDGGEYSLSYDQSPRNLFSASVKSSDSYTVKDLVRNLTC